MTHMKQGTVSWLPISLKHITLSSEETWLFATYNDCGGYFLWYREVFYRKTSKHRAAYWYISNVSTFSNDFPLVLNSNLHDLNETNPRLTLFLAELPWCCFYAEIKVLGMERNFARIFYINKENSGAKSHLRGGGAHNPPGRALVGCPHLVAPMTLKPTL